MISRRIGYCFLLTGLLFACNTAVRQQKAIKELALKRDSYALAVKIGEYVHHHPADMKHLPGYARLLNESGYFAESIRLSDHILQLLPGDNFTRQTLAMDYYNTLDFSKSIDLYRKILESPMADPSAGIEYRKTLAQFEVYSEICRLDTVIRNSPGTFDALLRRANLFLKMSKGKAAMSDFAFYLDSAGYDRDVAFNRFRAAIMSGLPEEAAKEIERIRKNSAPGDPLTDHLSALLADTRSGYAKIKSKPEAPEGYESVAKSLVFLKLEAESIPYLEKALSRDSLNARIRIRLAYVYAVSGRKEDAKSIIRDLRKQGKKIPGEILKILDQ